MAVGGWQGRRWGSQLSPDSGGKAAGEERGAWGEGTSEWALERVWGGEGLGRRARARARRGEQGAAVKQSWGKRMR